VSVHGRLIQLICAIYCTVKYDGSESFQLPPRWTFAYPKTRIAYITHKRIMLWTCRRWWLSSRREFAPYQFSNNFSGNSLGNGNS